MAARPRFETTPERSYLMSRVRQTGTDVELVVQRIVRRLGARFTVGAKRLPGSPDLSNRRQNWAIFVHGCYWHGHNGCRRATVPKRNRTVWLWKFEDNRKRDRRKVAQLRRLGFSVLTVWQCELDDEEKLERRIGRFLPG